MHSLKTRSVVLLAEAEMHAAVRAEDITRILPLYNIGRTNVQSLQ
jgi:hypothetical protein